MLGVGLSVPMIAARRGGPALILAVLVDENGELLIDESGNAYTMLVAEEPAP